jgi:dipeptidyl aminopeptidase/acylaminoacyl peptidase
MRATRCSRTAFLAVSIPLVLTCAIGAMRHNPEGENTSLPLRQTAFRPAPGMKLEPWTLRDASRDDRWLGLGVRDIRWAPGGEEVFFRWNTSPAPADDPEADPWFSIDREGRRVRQLAPSEVHLVPSGELSWSSDGTRSAWLSSGRVYSALSRSGRTETRLLYSAEQPAHSVAMQPDGRNVHFMIGEDLYALGIEDSALRQLTRKMEKRPARLDAEGWLWLQQEELFVRHREEKARRQSSQERVRGVTPLPQAIPVEPGTRLQNVRVSPDGRFVTFLTRKESRRPEPTRYLDYATASGYAEPREARPKVGAPQPEYRMGIVTVDTSIDPEVVQVRWVDVPAGHENAIVHGPYWNPEGRHAAVQISSPGFKDRWIARLDLETASTRIIWHDHDEAWLGGPPPVAGNLRPALIEWLDEEHLAFASERSGWCHLYVAGPNDQVRPLTEGAWEVREAVLSSDRRFWLIAASREHPCDDHLYTMPATGGPLTLMTPAEGRFSGFLSPDGSRLAVVHSESDRMPDLYLRSLLPDDNPTRITESGTENYYRRRLVRPEVVSFPHPDGKPVWAALFKPERPNRERAAVVHAHGGGYRHFSHRGWSVYGYGNHLGLINYLLGQGYVVLDFDYRGSAGFGRDYRTDIYRSMGEKDVEGAIAAVDYLSSVHGVDRSRVGVYGVSYGGFFTLMALFKHPGLFAAGVANAAVSDWAHYNHGWTGRILNVPVSDPEAYRLSSPIYYGEALRDRLLIVHGLIDDNVHFQDAARLAQRLIELEKDFEVMYYPMERHTIGSESSRYDYVRRVATFFDTHLRRR